MKNLSTFVLCLVVGINDVVSAFSFQSNNVQPTSVVKEDGTTTRRNWIDQVVTASIATVAMTAAGTVTTTATIEPAHASGGATAGGAYLLSAKQRYNDRVKKSVTALLAVGEALAAGSSKEAKAYFTEEDAGSYKDLTAAGYLLSNAFRRNSTTPPDSLPAVKVRHFRVNGKKTNGKREREIERKRKRKRSCFTIFLLFLVFGSRPFLPSNLLSFFQLTKNSLLFLVLQI